MGRSSIFQTVPLYVTVVPITSGRLDLRERTRTWLSPITELPSNSLNNFGPAAVTERHLPVYERREILVQVR